MFLTIDERSSEPLYLQIRNQIVSAIVRGELEVGQTLPSVRKLACDLGINLHTVNKAYALLQDEGYVCMQGRAGTTVVERNVADEQQLSALYERTARALERLALEFCASGGTEQAFLSLSTRAIQSVQPQRAGSGAGMNANTAAGARADVNMGATAGATAGATTNAAASEAAGAAAPQSPTAPHTSQPKEA